MMFSMEFVFESKYIQYPIFKWLISKPALLFHTDMTLKQFLQEGKKHYFIFVLSVSKISLLTLSQTSAGFYMSAVQVF